MLNNFKYFHKKMSILEKLVDTYNKEFGYKNSSNYHEVVAGSLHQDDTQANAMNGFQLIATTQNFRKICLTVYGVARA